MSETTINGIDVSECSYYNKDNEPYCCEVWDNECEAQNCYFKQLKRLQEENEKLKAEIKNNKTALQIELDAYNTECGSLLKENEELLDENKKYKQALEEIREIAIKSSKSEDYIIGGILADTMDEIYNLINEVLNERYR